MKTFRAVATGVLALVLLTGCGSDPDDSPTAGVADVDPSNDDDVSDEPRTPGDTTGAGADAGSGDTPESGVDDGPADDTPADSPDDDGADPPDDATSDPDDEPDDASEHDDPTDPDDATDGGSIVDGSPSDDDPVDDDADGEDGDGANPNTDDGALPDLVNADNYVRLTEFAVRMNILTLSDRSRSPTAFIQPFPPDVDALVQQATETMQAAFGTAALSEACPLGGHYEANASASPVGSFYRVAYDDCAFDHGALDGEYSVSSAPRERFEEYDLEYSYEDSANGPGTTVFDAAYTMGEFAVMGFEIERYARDTPQHPFAVHGSGGSSPDLHSSANDRVYGTNTTIWFETDGRSIDLNVAVNRLVLDEGAPTEGTISLVAQDGSGVDVSVPDASGTVALTRTDREGETFTDTVAWREIYRPPEQASGTRRTAGFP